MNTMTIVLFDDERFILKALQRTINRIYPVADVITVTELNEFWAVLKENKTIDLVISDYLMPHINGLDVLERCLTENPYPVRALLTGDSSLTSKMRQSNVVHMYLAKPFNKDNLILLFDNVADLKALPFSDTMRRKLGSMPSFPVYPLLLKELNNLINSGDYDLANVAEVVAKEPIIVAKLLQLANSAYLGFTRETSSIEEAVSRLGTTILLSISASLLIAQNSQSCLSASEHEQHLSQATHYASCVKKFAQHIKMSQKEQALLFSVALLSFVGKLIKLEGEEKSDLSAEEPLPEHCISYLHISAYVMKLWGYSSQVCSLIINSSELKAPDDKLGNVLFIVQQKLFYKESNEALITFCQHHDVDSSIYEAIGTFDWE
jgi:HD-like signal output (HDOD) protein/ActR/RegA family two-component response regulator